MNQPEVRAIAELLAGGMSYSQIGVALGITKNRAIGIVARAKRQSAGLPDDILAVLDPAALLVGILDLKPRQCRFITGHHEAKGAIFCAAVVERSSYCTTHYNMCYRPVADIDLSPDGY